MSAGVIIKIDNARDREGWTFVLRAFNVTEIYELPGLGRPLDTSIGLETVDDVTYYHDAGVVVIAPQDGDFVQGDTDLRDLDHPVETIYIFGGAQTRLTQHDLEHVTPAALVYLPKPNPKAELYPSQAGAIVLWDRYTKRGFA